MTTNDDIVKYARTWIGSRWRHQGRGPKGIDCVGLLVRTMLNFEIPHRDVKGYRRDPSPQFIRALNECTDWHDVPIHGAIGVFNDSVMPCHTGIFAVENGNITVIHSEAFPAGRCLEDDFHSGNVPLSARLTGVRLFREVDYVF